LYRELSPSRTTFRLLRTGNTSASRSKNTRDSGVVIAIAVKILAIYDVLRAYQTADDKYNFPENW
jgi:hypothetical protein